IRNHRIAVPFEWASVFINAQQKFADVYRRPSRRLRHWQVPRSNQAIERRLELKTKASINIVLTLSLCAPVLCMAQDGAFDGLDNHLGDLYRLSDAKSRSISPENFTGEKGKGGMATDGTGARAARDLGQG